MSNLNNLTDRIRFLEHLSYLLECLALDYTGEAKTEFSGAIELFDRIENISDEEKQDLSSKLNHAKGLLMGGDSNQAAGYLSQVSRKIWSEVLNELPK